MADFTFGGPDDELPELKELNAEVLKDTDNFENWEKLVQAAESVEGGINRNSSPTAITAVRNAYDRFLAKFPLLFGYWKKYADLEFSIAGTEAAEMVYERGVASINSSVDLWTNYCSFKVNTSHDPDVIRELFERGASSVGLDFLAHPFWDKYIEFEERLEAHDKILAILARVVHIPMHQYARYFERYRQMTHSRPAEEAAPADVLTRLRSEVERDAQDSLSLGIPKAEAEVERELRAKIDNFHLGIFAKTQAETTRRWTYESEIKRPYFHVTELDDAQLTNWTKYLDFEEAQGDYTRTQFLYERCLVTCAQYDEYWLRYARWMSAQPGKEEEVRNIYQRASCIFVPIARPQIRLQYAYFEEMSSRVEVAKDIHEAILFMLPGHIETIVSLANTCRRNSGLDAAIQTYQDQLSSPLDISVKAAVLAEWANLLWKVKGSAEEARQVYQKNRQYYLESPAFWTAYLSFEIQQPSSLETEENQYTRIKSIIDDVRAGQGHLAPETIRELAQMYMMYLLTRGGKDAAKEYLVLEREINGPASVNKIEKRSGEDEKLNGTGANGVAK